MSLAGHMTSPSANSIVEPAHRNFFFLPWTASTCISRLRLRLRVPFLQNRQKQPHLTPLENCCLVAPRQLPPETIFGLLRIATTPEFVRHCPISIQAATVHKMSGCMIYAGLTYKWPHPAPLIRYVGIQSSQIQE